MYRIYFSSVIVLFSGVIAFAGSGHFTAKEPESWATNEPTSVVIGHISKITKDQRNFYEAEFAPMFTMTGPFDCGLTPKIKVRFTYYGHQGPDGLWELPKNGDLIMTLIDVTPPNEFDNEFIGDLCSSVQVEFMPHESSAVVLTGMDDPQIATTMAKIQKIRSVKESKESTEKATTTPAKDHK